MAVSFKARVIPPNLPRALPTRGLLLPFDVRALALPLLILLLLLARRLRPRFVALALLDVVDLRCLELLPLLPLLLLRLPLRFFVFAICVPFCVEVLAGLGNPEPFLTRAKPTDIVRPHFLPRPDVRGCLHRKMMPIENV
jgi:hypothetical protein